MSSLAYTLCWLDVLSLPPMISSHSPPRPVLSVQSPPSLLLSVCASCSLLHFLSFPPYSKQIQQREDPISGLTDDALLVKMQGLLVDLWKETSLLELLVHDLAHGAIGSIGTNDQMADIRRLVHTCYCHLRLGLCNIDHPLARRQPIGGDL